MEMKFWNCIRNIFKLLVKLLQALCTNQAEALSKLTSTEVLFRQQRWRTMVWKGIRIPQLLGETCISWSKIWTERVVSALCTRFYEPTRSRTSVFLFRCVPSYVLGELLRFLLHNWWSVTALNWRCALYPKWFLFVSRVCALFQLHLT